MQNAAYSNEEAGTPSHNVRLEAYDGPLDLLLSLIKKNKINIYDIPIVEITGQYLEAIGLEEHEVQRGSKDFENPPPEFNLDAGGDFIEMAAQLIYIKSIMLLPLEQKGEAGEEEEFYDPRTELSNMLVEYQRIKDLALFLDNRPILGRDVFEINAGNAPEKQPEGELFDANVFLLSEYFYQKIKESAEKANAYEIKKENFSIKEKIVEIMETLNSSGRIMFKDLCPVGLEELFAYFIALLEMTRLDLINLDQVSPFGEIHISLSSKSVYEGYKNAIANIM